MSKPSAGTYIIYLRVLSPSGAKLALTRKSIDNAVDHVRVTIGGKSTSEKQRWILEKQ
ncbi:hypothetical protein M422DRAFT_179845 [Sphaerobolus stellatus SS14]|uniref:CCL2-like lectin domain-containing protein n=1 Tax=Sphaerobolus stellatus (strain SS14) TaxID=990650 RepID=A0A0C9VEQ4_SPHS4|nr:hypothetical protein M422DRAFT_179845 [Sphaerobolus stellatus SS14]